jgi:ribosomal-protein-alanine N-acetyltransferase
MTRIFQRAHCPSISTTGALPAIGCHYREVEESLLCLVMTIKTKSLTLIPHVPAHLLALLKDSGEYEKTSGRRIAHGVQEFLLAASGDFITELRTATSPDPWKFGFAIVHQADNIVIGLCGFAGAPDSDRAVEIAYSIAPVYERQGFATEAAVALVDFASRSGLVSIVRAHTLPEVCPSTSVLEKCSFRKTGEIIDSENNPVWRWEREISTPPTS